MLIFNNYFHKIGSQYCTLETVSLSWTTSFTKPKGADPTASSEPLARYRAPSAGHISRAPSARYLLLPRALSTSRTRGPFSRPWGAELVLPCGAPRGGDSGAGDNGDAGGDGVGPNLGSNRRRRRQDVGSDEATLGELLACFPVPQATKNHSYLIKKKMFH
jgi:hypothetical protein